MHFFVAKDKRLEYVAFKLKKIITFKIVNTEIKNETTCRINQNRLGY